MTVNKSASQWQTSRALAVVAIAGVAAAFTLLVGSWPQIFTFATDPNTSAFVRLLSAPVHLADDVMVTVRSGEMILQTGEPAFNPSDSAQAATSYLAPYIVAALIAILPFNIAVMAFGLLGFAAVVGTYVIIAWKAQSLINAAILVAALALTVTNVEFALTGWDHLLQGFLLAGAVALSLSPPLGRRRLLTISVLTGLAVLARPDGALIAAGVLTVSFLTTGREWRRAVVPLIAPMGVLMGVFLLLNFVQFGFLTPTTARLKAGAAPSVSYMWDYLYANGVVTYTAASLIVILTVVSAIAWKRIRSVQVGLIMGSALITAAVAAVNSDFFPGARMFWTPAVVMATALAVTLPAIFRAGPALPLNDSGHISTGWSRNAERMLVAGVVGAVFLGGAVVGLERAVVSKEALAGSRTAEQFLATEWINANLDPSEGAIGVFFAGEAAHLPNFEAADFLGKGDESVATLEPQWGPPGHNKWDIDLTLDKWRPQAILSTIDQDPRAPESDAIASEWRDRQWTHGYLADLITNETIRSDYRYCRVIDPAGFVDSSVDLLLRIDVIPEVESGVTCSTD